MSKTAYFTKLDAILTLFILLLIGCDGGDGTNPIDVSCQNTASYPDQAASEYILPWAIGKTYKVGQGNCTVFSHTTTNNQQFAYDILMSIGTSIHAARRGTVAAVGEGFIDGTGISGQENFIFIEHDDGSIGRYAHLTRQGALFEVGENVEQGEVIALSGNTGASTVPHLHLMSTMATAQF